MKILMIIAKNDFQDEEFQIPHHFFMSKGLEVEVASSEKGICIGKHGAEADADLRLDDINVEDYKAIVLIGGSGSKEFDEDQEMERILIEAKEQNKILAAICRAPVILAKAGIIAQEKSTVYPSEENIAALKEHKVEYVEEEVVLDKKLVTANGPEAAEEFAECVYILVKNN